MGRRKKWLILWLAAAMLMPAGQGAQAKAKVKSILPTWLAAGAATSARETPSESAAEVFPLTTDRFYYADQHVDQYYLVQSGDGQTGYVSKGDVRIVNPASLTPGSMFKLPHVAKSTPRLPVELVMTPAVIQKEGASMTLPEADQQMGIPQGSRLYAFTAYGDFAAVCWKGQLGYVRRDQLTMLTGDQGTAYGETMPVGEPTVQKSRLLEQAFSFLEEGNPVLLRYNRLTGRKVKPLFAQGVPYFWGGQDAEILMERMPEYTTRKEWAGALKFYEKDQIYIYGLDCVGYVKTVFEWAGRPLPETINDLNSRAHCKAGDHLYCSEANPLPEDWAELARNLIPGDVLAIHHPGRHVMIFIGTLRDYGYTEDQLPALAEYLDYPLMIHSGENPYAFWRFEALTARSEDSRLSKAMGSVGGVSLCLLGVPREAAEQVITANEREAYCFDVEGACVTIMSFHNVKDYFIWRHPDL